MDGQNKIGAQIIYLKGRVDAYEKMRENLTRSIEASKERIKGLEAELIQGVSSHQS